MVLSVALETQLVNDQASRSWVVLKAAPFYSSIIMQSIDIIHWYTLNEETISKY